MVLGHILYMPNGPRRQQVEERQSAGLAVSHLRHFAGQRIAVIGRFWEASVFLVPVDLEEEGSSSESGTFVGTVLQQKAAAFIPWEKIATHTSW